MAGEHPCMPGPVFAFDDGVELRTVEEEDLEFVQRWRNHPDVRVPIADTDPQNGTQMEEYFEDAVSNDDGVNFLVCVDPDGAEPTRHVPEDAEAVPVGEVYVPWVNGPAGSGMLVYWIAPPHQGNGYATAGTRLLLDHAFRERRLAKVWAHVYETNEGSRRVLQKLGFVEEGRLRKEGFVDGERVDTLRYGLLAEEWLDRE